MNTYLIHGKPSSSRVRSARSLKAETSVPAADVEDGRPSGGSAPGLQPRGFEPEAVLQQVPALRQEMADLIERVARLENGSQTVRVLKTDLSPREREILELRRQGAKQVEIAAKLRISEGTVRAVERRVRRKQAELRRRGQPTASSR